MKTENNEFQDGLPPEESKALIDKVSASFCSAKWLQLTLNLHNGETASCCLTKPIKVPLTSANENPASFHNLPENFSDRQQMLKGSKPSSCDFCWKQEEQNPATPSERVLKSAAPWAHEHMQRVESAGAEKAIDPSYLEVSFSSKCNLRCMYCAPQTSSRIRKEIEKFGPYLDSQKNGDLSILDNIDTRCLNEETNPYLPAFSKWFKAILPGLRVLRFTGGEPLLSKNVFVYLEKFKTHKHPDLDIEINSNLSLSKSIVKRFIELIKEIPRDHYKNLKMITSIDTDFTDASYIRAGLNSKLLKENVDYLLNSLPHLQLRFTATFNILSFFNFTKLLDYFLELKREYKTYDKILFSLYPLISPEYMSLPMANGFFDSEMDEIEKYLKKYQISEQEPFGFNAYEIDSFEKVKTHYKQSLDENELKSLTSDFYFFIKDYDVRKKSNLLETFPKMQSFWRLCGENAKKDLEETLSVSSFDLELFDKLLLYLQRVNSCSEEAREKVFQRSIEVMNELLEKSFWELRAKIQTIFDPKIRDKMISCFYQDIKPLIKTKIVTKEMDTKVFWNTVELIKSVPNEENRKDFMFELVENLFNKRLITPEDHRSSYKELYNVLDREQKKILKKKYLNQLLEHYFDEIEKDLSEAASWIDVIRFFELSKDEIIEIVQKNSEKKCEMIFSLNTDFDDLDWWILQAKGGREFEVFYNLIRQEEVQIQEKFFKQFESIEDDKTFTHLIHFYLTIAGDSSEHLALIDKFLTKKNLNILDRAAAKALTETKVDRKKIYKLLKLVKDFH